MFCKYCGAVIDDESAFCNKCGKPVEKDSAIYRESTDINNPVKKKKGKGGIVAIIIILVVLAILGYKAYQFVESYKYQNNLYDAYNCITEGISDSEDICVLTNNVWQNCILQVDDDETDKYTKDHYYYFYTDFNDALEKLYDDTDIISKQGNIIKRQSESVDLMKELKNPPKRYEEEYDAMKDMYDVFVDFSNLALNPGGYSLNEYSEDVKEYQKEAIKCIKNVNMYLN